MLLNENPPSSILAASCSRALAIPHGAELEFSYNIAQKNKSFLFYESLRVTIVVFVIIFGVCGALQATFLSSGIDFSWSGPVLTQTHGLQETNLKTQFNLGRTGSYFEFNHKNFAGFYKKRQAAIYLGPQYSALSETTVEFFAGPRFSQEYLSQNEPPVLKTEPGGLLRLTHKQMKLFFLANGKADYSTGVAYAFRWVRPLVAEGRYEKLPGMPAALHSRYWILWHKTLATYWQVSVPSQNMGLGTALRFDSRLTVQTNIKFPSQNRGEIYSKIALKWRFNTIGRRAKLHKRQTVSKKAQSHLDREKAKTKIMPVKAKPKKKARKLSVDNVTPSFRTMVGWGINPRQALTIRRAGSVCAANSRSRRILKLHSWHCYSQSKK